MQLPESLPYFAWVNMAQDDGFIHTRFLENHLQICVLRTTGAHLKMSSKETGPCKSLPTFAFLERFAVDAEVRFAWLRRRLRLRSRRNNFVEWVLMELSRLGLGRRGAAWPRPAWRRLRHRPS